MKLFGIGIRKSEERDEVVKIKLPCVNVRDVITRARHGDSVTFC